MEEHEIHGIVFVGFMLTIMSCTAVILYVRTSCLINPIALREVLRARRDFGDGYLSSSTVQENQVVQKRNFQRAFGEFRVKRVTTEYEVQQEGELARRSF